jgi:acetyl esterase/lipase
MSPSSPFDPAAVAPETAEFNAQLADLLAEMPKPYEVPVETIRALRAEGRGIFPLAGPLADCAWREIDGPDGPVALRVAEPERAPRGTYLHIHGGGWTLNAPEQYDAHNLRIARAAGARVLSVRYRLAPEHRWPAPGRDCLAAARHALAEEPGPLVIGGESAGAHLAAVTLLALRDEGRLAGVAGASLSYGMFDLRGTPSMRNWGERYLVLSTPVIDWFVGNLLGGGDAGRAEVSPLLADLAGLPPALFQVGTADPLLDDTLFMAARWEAAGNAVERAIRPGGVHAFDQFDLPIAREAAARQDAFIAARLAA